MYSFNDSTALDRLHIHIPTHTHCWILLLAHATTMNQNELISFIRKNILHRFISVNLHNYLTPTTQLHQHYTYNITVDVSHQQYRWGGWKDAD